MVKQLLCDMKTAHNDASLLPKLLFVDEITHSLQIEKSLSSSLLSLILDSILALVEDFPL